MLLLYYTSLCALCTLHGCTDGFLIQYIERGRSLFYYYKIYKLLYIQCCWFTNIGYSDYLLAMAVGGRVMHHLTPNPAHTDYVSSKYKYSWLYLFFMIIIFLFFCCCIDIFKFWFASFQILLLLLVPWVWWVFDDHHHSTFHLVTCFDEWLSCFCALEQTTPSFKYSYIAQVLHRGHSPLSYSHAAVLHPEFGFGFTLSLGLLIFV